jgi:hypothetical protein
MNEVEKAQQIPAVKDGLANSYANPGGVKDVAWWREAMPTHNMVVFGGKEIFHDDISEFCHFCEDVSYS